MLIGYMRVSTAEQSLDLQRDALEKAGCRKIYEDVCSGRATERPGLAQALDTAREGDTLVIWKLDRIGRSLPHVVGLVGELQKQGIGLKGVTTRKWRICPTFKNVSGTQVGLTVDVVAFSALRAS